MTVQLEQQIMWDEKKRRQQSYTGPGFHLNQSWKPRIAADSSCGRGNQNVQAGIYFCEKNAGAFSLLFHVTRSCYMPAYTSRISQRNTSELRLPSQQLQPLPPTVRALHNLILGAAEDSCPCCQEAFKALSEQSQASLLKSLLTPQTLLCSCRITSKIQYLTCSVCVYCSTENPHGVIQLLLCWQKQRFRMVLSIKP